MWGGAEPGGPDLRALPGEVAVHSGWRAQRGCGVGVWAAASASAGRTRSKAEVTCRTCTLVPLSPSLLGVRGSAAETGDWKDGIFIWVFEDRIGGAAHSVGLGETWLQIPVLPLPIQSWQESTC